MNPLNHVAIIMDGNGRWGLRKYNSRNKGHRAGLDTIEKIITASINQKIKYLTLFAFSTENWKRPKKEINYLFKLLENFLTKRLDDIHKQNIKIKELKIYILFDKLKIKKKESKNIERIISIEICKIHNLNELEKYKFRNILIGDLIYDSYLKKYLLPTIDIKSIQFRTYFAEFIKNFIFIFWRHSKFIT